jgi:hypothetical protein
MSLLITGVWSLFRGWQSHLARKTQTFEKKQTWKKKTSRFRFSFFSPKIHQVVLGPVKTVEEVAAARGIKSPGRARMELRKKKTVQALVESVCFLNFPP